MSRSVVSSGAESGTTQIVVPYKSGAGTAKKEFTIYRTHHGPIVREADGK